jgi:hypothetical protein
MADAQDRSPTTERTDEVPPGGAFSAPIETEEGEELSPPSAESLQDIEQQKERVEEARTAMWKEGKGDIPGAGVQEEETARIADSLAFPGTGVRQFKEAVGEGKLEEAVENLRVEQETASAQDKSDAVPPADWPPPEQSSG